MRQKILMSCAMVLGFLAFTGCNANLSSGENSNASIPDFLPDTIGLDISEMPDEDGAGAKVRQVEGQLTLRYDRTVRAAAQVAHTFQRLAAKALKLGASIREDMTDPNETQVAGAFTVDGALVAYRADFAPFDINGDGIAEGTGVATIEPVAIRIWTDHGEGFERFLCAVITARPSSARTGIGELFVRPASAEASGFHDLQLHILWDHSGASHSFNDAFISGQIRGNVSVSIANTRVDIRENGDGSIEKTIRTTSLFTENPWGFESFASAVHHLRGTQTFLVSALSTGGELQVDYSQACVNRSSREKTDDSECNGLDTQDMILLPAPPTTAAEFPSDFPATPTFGE